MRQGLRKIYKTDNRTGRFYATVELILQDGRILLKDLKNRDKKVIESHFWTGLRYWFGDIEPVIGQEVTFIADIRTYHRRDGSRDLKPVDLREIKAVGGS